ncbi:hypothetical protein EYE35_01085 [Cereibacter sphaeroides]|nr:hypothetical protein EYE35_01085 [Cereibacter sphaeroides]RDS95201.1 hypothetical protein DWF04_12765 [Cereibacter sphaeroides f. sp. denitrificans]
MAQATFKATPSFAARASGPGDVTFSCLDADGEWTISATTAASAAARGFIAAVGQTVSLGLESGEHLQIRGRGDVHIVGPTLLVP